MTDETYRLPDEEKRPLAALERNQDADDADLTEFYSSMPPLPGEEDLLDDQYDDEVEQGYEDLS